MSVRVIFRGLILFRTEWVNKKEVVVEALMPNTSRWPKASKDGTHYDGKNARRHHAGLLIPTTKPMDITNAVVDFSPDSGAGYIEASHLVKFPRIDAPKGKSGEPLIFDAHAPLAARIDMRFPSIPTATCDDEQDYCKFGALAKLPLALIATFEHGLVVRVKSTASPVAEVTVPNNTTLYVYHADDLDPDEAKLLKKGVAPPKGTEDIDFKWYYSLLEPRSDAFENWATGTLPAPVYDPPNLGPKGPPFPSVSTCFPAWI